MKEIQDTPSSINASKKKHRNRLMFLLFDTNNRVSVQSTLQVTPLCLISQIDKLPFDIDELCFCTAFHETSHNP